MGGSLGILRVNLELSQYLFVLGYLYDYYIITNKGILRVY